MTTRVLYARTLSAIHIGDGSDWTPETFRLTSDSRLERFEPSAVLADCDGQTCRLFLQQIAANNLAGAQRLLQGAMRPEHVLERIAVSDKSLREIREALASPEQRSGRINPFIRTGGRPFLPGSTIKGAIRTALLSVLAERQLEALSREFRDIAQKRGKTGPRSDALQRQLFGIGGEKTDSDPFRFIRVADAELPRDSTRIERPFNRRRDGQRKFMQMHFECLPAHTLFTIEVQVNTDDAEIVREKACRGDPRKAPGLIIGEHDLFSAIDRFFRGRWRAERGRFFAGGVTTEPPLRSKDNGFPVLLRLGRFSHFESASVDGLRCGWQPQQGGKPLREGGTRAVTDDDRSFGWILLSDRQDALPSLTTAAAPVVTKA